MHTRLVALLLLVLSGMHPPASAQPLDGTWIAVLDVNGVVFPHLEELRIERGGRVATAIYGLRDIPQCDHRQLDTTGDCAPGQPNASGELALDTAKGTLAVNSSKLGTGAMRGLGTADHDERLARDLFWFGPGAPWSFQREDDVLIMLRQSRPAIPNTEFDGSKTVTIEKRFYPVDPAFAADLVGFAAGAEASLVKLACVMPFAVGSAASAREFRILMSDVATIARQREQLLASLRAQQNPGKAAAVARALSVLSARDGAPSARDIADAAATFGATVEQVQRFVREIALRPPVDAAEALVFTPLRPHAAEIHACHKRYFE